VSTSRSASGRALRPVIVEPRRRQEPILARPQVVGIMVAGALAMVVTAVFTMAELSGRVGGESARLHALDVVALKVEAIRFQLGTVTILRDSDPEATSSAMSDARANLDELAGIEASGIDLIGSELNDFINAGNSLAVAFEQRKPSEVLDNHFQHFATAHQSLTDQLGTNQADRIEAIQSTTRLLSRFAALGGGLLAFVVPLVALYVQRRVGQRRLASYEFDADLRWLLTANELERAEITKELATGLDELPESPDLAEQRLRRLLTRLEVDDGNISTHPVPIDVVELFTDRPEFPGLRRLVEVDNRPVCNADPTILSAAFASIEWAVAQAGSDKLVLSTGRRTDAWQQFDIRGEGWIEAHNLAEIVGPLRSIETALASTGLPVASDRNNLWWSIDVPLSEPVAR